MSKRQELENELDNLLNIEEKVVNLRRDKKEFEGFQAWERIDEQYHDACRDLRWAYKKFIKKWAPDE